MFDLLIIIGAGVVTGVIVLVIWPIAQWLRPARTYDLDTAHVSLALGRQRGSQAACWLAELQLRKEAAGPGMAKGSPSGPRTGRRQEEPRNGPERNAASRSSHPARK